MGVESDQGKIDIAKESHSDNNILYERNPQKNGRLTKLEMKSVGDIVRYPPTAIISLSAVLVTELPKPTTQRMREQTVLETADEANFCHREVEHAT